MNTEAIWIEYSDYLKRFLTTKVSNPDDRDDLLQVIILKTHQNLKSLSSNEKIRPWLMQIANRTIIDFYRKRATQSELNADDLWYHDMAVEQDLAECIEPFIRQLPEAQSELLRVIEIEGVSQKDYAAQKNISYSTLKSRVQKARQDLKGVFDACCRTDVAGINGAGDCRQNSKGCDSC